MSSVSCIWGKSWSYTNLEVTQTYMQFKSYHFIYFLPHWKWFIIHQLQPKHIYLLKVNPTGINETAFGVNVAAWKVWSSLTDTSVLIYSRVLKPTLLALQVDLQVFCSLNDPWKRSTNLAVPLPWGQPSAESIFKYTLCQYCVSYKPLRVPNLDKLLLLPWKETLGLSVISQCNTPSNLLPQCEGI